jgi:anti-sigma regulatory factor (Ser/Thr protein kinase)
LIGDIGLVLTELAANAIDHTESEYVGVVLQVDSSAVSIEVANDGDSRSIPDVVGWGSLAEGDRGRGLRLVRALCDDIELAGDEQMTVVRCRFQLS